MHHITRILYLALCVSGLVSGAFLLLCCFGVVDPALLFQREETAVLPTSAPAEVPQPEEAGTANAITLRTDPDRPGRGAGCGPMTPWSCPCRTRTGA